MQHEVQTEMILTLTQGNKHVLINNVTDNRDVEHVPVCEDGAERGFGNGGGTRAPDGALLLSPQAVTRLSQITNINYTPWCNLHQQPCTHVYFQQQRSMPATALRKLRC